MKKGKMIVSFVLMMVVLVICASSVFATDGSNTNTPTPITITGNSSRNTTNNVTTNNTATNNAPTQITANTSSNNSANNASSSVSSYNNSSNNSNTASNSQGLPYTGTSYSIVFIIIALVVSAIYAYKKVSDYNM